jgi:hypothetical protein
MSLSLIFVLRGEHSHKKETQVRKLAVNTFMSLDGVMQSPGGPDEDPTGGFELGGWGVNYMDD